MGTPFELRYRPEVFPQGPEPVIPSPGECGVWRSRGDTEWYFSFAFLRTTDGKPEHRSIPIVVGRDLAPGERGWSLKKAAPGRWQIHPSISCLEYVKDKDEQPKSVEVWHETPVIVGVPDEEPWTRTP